MSSGDHFSSRIGLDFFGRNTSSIRFAREIIFKVQSSFVLRSNSECESSTSENGKFKVQSSGFFHSFCTLSFAFCIASTARPSCHFPPSMMMRSGQGSSPLRAARVLRVSISSMDAKSSIFQVSSVFILYFLYRFVSGFPFVRTDLLATVCSP